MASALLVTWSGGGNVGPFAVLADALVARGHRVGLVAPPDVLDRMPPGCEPVTTPSGFLADGAEVLAATTALAADVVVVDHMLTAGLCGAEASGRPTVVLVHTLYSALLVDGAPSPMEMAGSVEDVNAARADLGLAPISRHGDLLDAAALVAVTSPAELDAPGDLPSNVHRTGILVEGAGPDAGWEPPDGAGPLVAVSLGTAGSDPANERAVLVRVLAALASLPVRGVVNLPAYLDPSSFDVPPNVALAGYVRHSALLPHAAVLVTHAGLGSVHAALIHGVPMVALPLDREQPANADAIERIGAGTALAPSARSDDIAAAIDGALLRPRPRPVRSDARTLVAAIEALLPTHLES